MTFTAGATLIASPVFAQSGITLYGMVDGATVCADNQKGRSNVHRHGGNVLARPSSWPMPDSIFLIDIMKVDPQASLRNGSPRF